MVDGVIGVNGKLVQLAAEEDTKIGLDYVTVRCRNLKGKIVLLMDHYDMRFRNAMKFTSKWKVILRVFCQPDHGVQTDKQIARNSNNDYFQTYY